MMSNQKYFQLYSNCFVVDGFKRSIILDSSSLRYYFVPNSLSQLIKELKSNSIDDVYNHYKDQASTIEEYIEFLLSKDVAHYVETDELELFVDFNTAYSNPRFIMNSIVEFNANNFMLILKQLEELLCDEVLVRANKLMSKEDLSNLLILFNKSIITNISLELLFNNDFTSEFLLKLFEKFPRLNNIRFYNTNKDDLVCSHPKICYSSKNIVNVQCGNISRNFFIKNLSFYIEAINFNTCLHKKISIDYSGNIKNCPFSSQSYGNIKDTTFKQALEHPDFKKLWNITKDQIDVCKDCEFRYMCTDCRVYIKDPENIYSQPSKCTYNPYIAKWQGEEGYVPVEECGAYSRETGFVVNPERVAELNAQIWGE